MSWSAPLQRRHYDMVRVFVQEDGEGVWNGSPLHRRDFGFVIRSGG